MPPQVSWPDNVVALRHRDEQRRGMAPGWSCTPNLGELEGDVRASEKIMRYADMRVESRANKPRELELMAHLPASAIGKTNGLQVLIACDLWRSLRERLPTVPTPDVSIGDEDAIVFSWMRPRRTVVVEVFDDASIYAWSNDHSETYSFERDYREIKVLADWPILPSAMIAFVKSKLEEA